MLAGKLYTVVENYWLLWPTEEAVNGREAYRRYEANANASACYWSDSLGCHVHVVKPDTLIAVLSVSRGLDLRTPVYKILTGDGLVGWIGEVDIDWMDGPR
jgi:hypothetical protein